MIMSIPFQKFGVETYNVEKGFTLGLHFFSESLCIKPTSPAAFQQEKPPSKSPSTVTQYQAYPSQSTSPKTGLATYDLSELQIEGDANCQKLVIKTRSIEFMPFYLSPATFLISLSFFAYGLFREDPFIYVSIVFPADKNQFSILKCKFQRLNYRLS
ncbi:uncharacterized protein LOC112182757 isoform X3 [Rosa chinensis]|nr:uncharacterized protein LOC112182757 isoform X3 [Rosa chinensis]